MVEERRCLLSRKMDKRGLRKGIGHCDIGDNTTSCKGDVHYYEKIGCHETASSKRPEELRKRRKG